MSFYLPETENSLKGEIMSLKDKYASVLELGKNLDVKGGDVKEEGGKLKVSGTAAYELDKDL
jgi:hypothetical protein